MMVLLFGLAALFALAAAGAWLKLGKRNGADFPAARFKAAAIQTALMLALLGASLLLLALEALQSI